MRVYDINRGRIRPADYAGVLWDFDRYLEEQLVKGALNTDQIRTLKMARERLHRLVTDHHGADVAA